MVVSFFLVLFLLLVPMILAATGPALPGAGQESSSSPDSAEQHPELG